MLFEIDPDDYELALEKAKSALAALDEQIEIGRSQDEELKFGVKADEAGVAARQGASKTDERHLASTRASSAERFRDGGASRSSENLIERCRASVSRRRAKTESSKSGTEHVANAARATTRRGRSC